MQYNFISNITSNGVKGSAILGIFSDLSVNFLSKSINAANQKKINTAKDVKAYAEQMGMSKEVIKKIL